MALGRFAVVGVVLIFVVLRQSAVISAFTKLIDTHSREFPMCSQGLFSQRELYKALAVL